ncbi:hypothetical protein INT44_006864 [Umbelopsis vinacea]|uniref:Uncharacterized protein n=1 Tax=Umbelopsis vinacea TaxID=44442 RepID=A0A8H7PJW4_9FUNG|nr:hypothetical protein INT44_006864 [Umbelopsis vinacea]
MEEDSMPPALSPAISSLSSPSVSSCFDEFEMSGQESTETDDTNMMEPLHRFVVTEDTRRSPLPVRVVEWDPDALDFVLFENEQDDFCLAEEDMALDRRLVSLGCPDNSSTS